MKEKKRLSRRVSPAKKLNRERRKKYEQRKEQKLQRAAQKREDKLPYALIKTAEEIEQMKEIRARAEARQAAYLVKQKEEQVSKRKIIVPSTGTAEALQVIKEADVIIHVIDARDPIGSRLIEIENIVRSAGKKLLLLLNKADLVPQDNCAAWVNYLSKQAPCMAFAASVGSHSRSQFIGSYSQVPALIKLLKGWGAAAEGGTSTMLTVGVIGCSNSGKSSLINSLTRNKKACPVQGASTSGVALRRVSLDRSVTLIDSPGVINRQRNPVSEALRAGTVSVSASLIDPSDLVSFIFSRCPIRDLCLLYRIEQPSTAEELLISIALSTGRLTKGAQPDTRAASFIILRDLHRGQIKFLSHPPEDTNSDYNTNSNNHLVIYCGDYNRV